MSDCRFGVSPVNYPDPDRVLYLPNTVCTGFLLSVSIHVAEQLGVMATSLGKGDELNCAICFQLYVEPRKLPGCSHCFCESCVVNFVLDLKKEEKLGSEFECPVCKLPSSSPGMDDSVHRWATTLEVNEEIKGKCVEEIDTDKCCSHCLGQEKIVTSDKYCFSCNEHYCGPCSETIHAFKVNKSHIVMDTAQHESVNFHEQAMKMLNGLTICSKHPKEAVMFYCEVEKKFCCSICSVDNHKQCRDLKPISVLGQECSKVESTKLLDLTSKLMGHIDRVVTAIKGNNDENKKKAEQLGVEYQEMKKKVINLLDIMETNLNDEGKAAVKNAAMKNQDEIDNLECSKQKLKMVRHLLESVIENTPGDMAFVCMRELEHIVESVEKSIIKEGKRLTTSGLELTTTETFRLIHNLEPNETPQLASVTMQKASIALPVYEDRPFLRKFSIQKTGVHKILPDRYEPDKPLQPTYSGILFLPDSQFLLVDSYYGFCCLVNKRFVPSRKWRRFNSHIDSNNFFSNERHATCLGDNIIAVSIASHKTILLLSPDGKYTEKVQLKCEYTPKALCGLSNGDIAIAWDKPVAFGVISSQIWKCSGKVYRGNDGLSYCEKVYFTEDKSGRKLQSFQFMAVDENRGHIIQPCDVDMAVYCFDMEGNHVFCYENEDLKAPRGVTLDREGNIYICENSLDSIHVISAEGMGITIIKEGCPSTPLAIGYNEHNNEFAVTVEDVYDCGEIHFFSVALKLT